MKKEVGQSPSLRNEGELVDRDRARWGLWDGRGDEVDSLLLNEGDLVDKDVLILGFCGLVAVIALGNEWYLPVLNTNFTIYATM